MKQLAVITGASSGIGAEFAHIISNENYHVLLVARRKDRLEALQKSIQSLGGHASIFVTDLTKTGEIPKLFNKIRTIGLPLGIFINNAGFGMTDRFQDGDWNRIKELMDLNINVLVECTWRSLQLMNMQKFGKILNVASTAAFQPIPYMSIYAASKALVSNFSMAIHEETKANGITVSCLHPGKTDTEFFEVAKMKDERFVKQVTSMNANIVARIGWNGMKKGKSYIVAGWLNKLLVLLVKISPLHLTIISSKFLFKPAHLR